MSYMTTLFQVVLLFGALGYGAYYMTKRRANSSFKQGENGHIQVKGGVYLNHQTSAFYLKWTESKCSLLLVITVYSLCN